MNSYKLLVVLLFNLNKKTLSNLLNKSVEIWGKIQYNIDILNLERKFYVYET